MSSILNAGYVSPFCGIYNNAFNLVHCLRSKTWEPLKTNWSSTEIIGEKEKEKTRIVNLWCVLAVTCIYGGSTYWIRIYLGAPYLTGMTLGLLPARCLEWMRVHPHMEQDIHAHTVRDTWSRTHVCTDVYIRSSLHRGDQSSSEVGVGRCVCTCVAFVLA